MSTFLGGLGSKEFQLEWRFGTHAHLLELYKGTKISSLEITIFYLKMMVKSGLDFLFWNSPSPFRVAAAQCKNICPEWPDWPGS